jgi:DNA repair protein RadC
MNPSKSHTAIKHWANDDKPREKMIALGPACLSNAELLAILINNGTKNKSAIDLARELLRRSNNKISQLAKMSLSDIQQTKGIGPAKAVSIKAALQMAVQLQAETMDAKTVVTTTRDMAAYLQARLQHESREMFVVVYLNRGNRIMGTEVMSTGGIQGTVVDPRIILKRAIEEKASSLVLSHNHPSGNLKPSAADLELTEKLKQGAKLIDVKVLDHIIVSDEGYYSFLDEGIL